MPSHVVKVGFALHPAIDVPATLLTRMPPTLGEWFASHANKIEDPEAPSKTRELSSPEELAQTIDALLLRARSWPVLEDLPRRLEAAAATLRSDTLVTAELLTAVKSLGEGFENFLKLIATVKYHERPELLHGGDAHVGFMGSPLGSLLLGTPSPRPGAKEDEKRAIPKAAIVRFQFGAKELAPRLYELVRNARNEVHAARQPDSYRLLGDARHLVAAYLLAVDENRKVLAQALAPHRDYLTSVLAKNRGRLPFIVEPMLEHAARRGSVTRLDGLVDLISETPRRLTITGDPGAGKTTLMRAIAGRLAERRLNAPFTHAPLPVYIEASRYTPERPFATHIAGELGVSAESLGNEWSARRLAVCLDGANEIPARFLREALLDIESLQERCASWSIVLTSRTHQLPGRLSFEGMRLLPFDDAQMLDYLRRAFLDTARADEFAQQLDQVPRLRQLCRNPLLLYMLVDISGESFCVPENRGRLLHEFMSRFLDREREAFLPIQPLTLSTVLSHLAYRMREQRAVALGERETHRIVAATVAGLQSGVGTVDVVAALIGANLLQRVGVDQLAFFHELVQEYFAALRLVERFESGHELPAGVGSDPWWQEVVILGYGLSKESTVLLNAIQHASVALSARSVLDAPVPSPAGLEAVVQGARTELAEGVQHEGLHVLAMVWTESAKRSLLAGISSASVLADALPRFREDPFASATDLLEIADTEEAIRGLALITHRLRGSRAQRLRLGQVLADRLAAWSRLGGAPIRAGDVPRLCHDALFSPKDARRAIAGVQAILEGLAQGGDAAKWIGQNTVLPKETSGDIVRSAWRQAAARLLLGDSVDALAKHALTGTESDWRWLGPFLPTLLERHPKEADAILAALSGESDAIGALNPSEGSTESEEIWAQEEFTPTSDVWTTMDSDQRARFFIEAYSKRSFKDVLVNWPEFIICDFRVHVFERLPRVLLPFSDEVWVFLGIPDKGMGVIRARITELLDAGDSSTARDLARRWKLPLPIHTPEEARTLSVQEMTPPDLLGALQEGHLPVADAEQWLLSRTRAGRTDDVLSIAFKLRRYLSGAATVAVSECLESGQEVFAGQLISAFGLEGAFAEELPRLAPILMAAGKPGLALQFTSPNSQVVTAVNRAAVERLEQVVQEGQIARAIEMVRIGGFAYLENDLRRLIDERVRECGRKRDAVGLAGLVDNRETWSIVRASALYPILESAGVLLRAQVRALRRRDQVGLLEVVLSGDRVSLSWSRSNRFLSDLAIGRSVYISVRQEGATLYANAVVEALGSETNTLITEPPAVEPPVAIVQPERSDAEAVEELARRWGARVRRE